VVQRGAFHASPAPGRGMGAGTALQARRGRALLGARLVRSALETETEAGDPASGEDGEAGEEPFVFPVRLACEHEVVVPCGVDHDEGASLQEYMTLPVSQFVLIDLPLGGELVRQAGNIFQLTVPQMKFFDIWVKPICIIDVRSREDCVTLDALECVVEGSPFVERMKISERIDLEVQTRFTWEGGDAIRSHTTISVGVDPPMPFSAFPKRLLRGTGNAVLRASLSALHKSFIQSLGKDYEKWAVDGEYRAYRATLTSD